MSRTAPGRHVRWRAVAALVCAVAGIAWSAIFIRWAGVPGPSSAFYRVFIAASVLVPVWVAAFTWSAPFRARASRSDPRAVILAIAGGAFFAGDLALWNTAVMRTTALTATLLGNCSPIFVGIGTWLIFRRRPAERFWMGLGLALSGAVIVVAATARSRTTGAGDPTGDLLALGSAVFFAGYLLTTERAREKLSTLTFSTAAILGSVLTLWAVCLVVDAPLGGFSGRAWAALLALGLITQLAAYFALVYALGHLPATVTSVGLLGQTPLTALLAVPLLGEPLNLLQGAGAAVALLGIFVVVRR